MNTSKEGTGNKNALFSNYFKRPVKKVSPMSIPFSNGSIISNLNESFCKLIDLVSASNSVVLPTSYNKFMYEFKFALLTGKNQFKCRWKIIYYLVKSFFVSKYYLHILWVSYFDN